MNEPRHPPRFLPAAAIALAFCLAGAATAMDQVSFRQDGKELRIEGRIEVTAADGGILLCGRDNVLWRILPEEQVERKPDDAPFRFFSAAEMARALRGELPRGFDVHETTHYLICYNTSRVYAQWCGGLFERLYTAFHTFWTRKGFDLTEPKTPLVAVVFADQDSYAQYAAPELKGAAKSIIGYFSEDTNRMTMYDLTGTQGGGPRRLSSGAQINQLLAAPDAVRTVATIVHEATHQLAFNCGLHTRLSDCPLWFAEGIAVFFETPDLRSAKGWAGIGAVNPMRLPQFQQYLHRRGRDSLRTLISSDRRFRDPKQVLDAYAEAWALTYFLIRQHPKQYVEYLRMVSAKKPLIFDTPERRIAQFERHFGDMKRLDGEFIRAMAKVR